MVHQEVRECRSCKGTGVAEGSDEGEGVVCPDCGGYGKIWVYSTPEMSKSHLTRQPKSLDVQIEESVNRLGWSLDQILAPFIVVVLIGVWVFRRVDVPDKINNFHILGLLSHGPIAGYLISIGPIVIFLLWLGELK